MIADFGFSDRYPIALRSFTQTLTVIDWLCQSVLNQPPRQKTPDRSIRIFAITSAIATLIAGSSLIFVPVVAVPLSPPHPHPHPFGRISLEVVWTVWICIGLFGQTQIHSVNPPPDARQLGAKGKSWTRKITTKKPWTSAPPNVDICTLGTSIFWGSLRIFFLQTRTPPPKSKLNQDHCNVFPSMGNSDRESHCESPRDQDRKSRPIRLHALSAGFGDVHSRFFLRKQRECRIHRITLMFRYLHSRANGSLITPITFTYSLQSRE